MQLSLTNQGCPYWEVWLFMPWMGHSANDREISRKQINAFNCQLTSRRRGRVRLRVSLCYTSFTQQWICWVMPPSSLSFCISSESFQVQCQYWAGISIHCTILTGIPLLRNQQRDAAVCLSSLKSNELFAVYRCCVTNFCYFCQRGWFFYQNMSVRRIMLILDGFQLIWREDKSRRKKKPILAWIWKRGQIKELK